jgi:heat shock protein HslJ
MRIRHKVFVPLVALIAACGQVVSGADAPAELAGRWDVQQIAGASLGEGVDVTVEIDVARGEIAGFTGCNGFSAPLSTFGETIAVGAIAEGEGACPSEAAATDEARFLGVLPHIQRFSRRGRSLELLPAAPGEALLLLRLADEQPTGAEAPAN